MQVLSIGEVLWDVFPDRELLGGAPLNFCANSVRLGEHAALITAVGDDDRGVRAIHAIAGLGIDTAFVQRLAEEPTGVANVTVSPEGEPQFEIPRPAAFDRVTLSPDILGRIRLLKPDWLYFGTLFQAEPHLEAITREIIDALPSLHVFYDMNLRSGAWNLPLVQRLSRLATILKLNEREAEMLGATAGLPSERFSLERFCALWAEEYQLQCICVTLGPAGCFVYRQGETHTIPGYPVAVQDTVGAGDAFAAAFLHGWCQGWPLPQTSRFANALGAIVASRPGATPSWTHEECLMLSRSL